MATAEALRGEDPAEALVVDQVVVAEASPRFATTSTTTTSIPSPLPPR